MARDSRQADRQSPGWYADAADERQLRFWDGHAWTGNTKFPTAEERAAQQGLVAPSIAYGSPAAPSPRPRPRPGPTASPAASPAAPASTATASLTTLQRNRFTFSTVAVVVIYIVIALTTKLTFLGVLPMLLAIRSNQLKEPLAALAFVAAGFAVVLAILIYL